MDKTMISEWFQSLQSEICESLENADGKGKFISDRWNRPAGGGGLTRVIANGNSIEKGGVNFSAVYGPTPSKILQALDLPECDFFATGVSIVIHPVNPHVPIIHMNVRYFEMSNGTWWFGGGIDLTPHYIIDEDAIEFHHTLKQVCDQHDEIYYPTFKKWADDYFYLKHRNETRGVGGIFFDRLSQTENHNLEQRFAFVKDVGIAFSPIYTHVLNKYKQKPFSEGEKLWQKIRRGRYAEFNLLWDKGTKFGLDTNGRTESILMSLPPEVNWEYEFKVEDNSREKATLSKLRKGIDWLNL